MATTIMAMVIVPKNHEDKDANRAYLLGQSSGDNDLCFVSDALENITYEDELSA